MDKICQMQNQKLGLGTIWTGRPWPMDNKSYKYPRFSEVERAFLMAHKNGVRHFDVAAAYGAAERRLGYFLQKHPEILRDSTIATKWGERWNKESGSTTDNSLGNLKNSFRRSLELLYRVDILYFHTPTVEVLGDPKIRAEYASLKEKGLIKFSGISVSDPTLLQTFFEKSLIWTDYLQISSWIIWNHETLFSSILKKCPDLRIVVNAPSRGCPEGMSIKDAYLRLTEKPYVDVVLTGTRRHLKETISYFQQ